MSSTDRYAKLPLLTENIRDKKPIPPVQVRFNECIGCNACAKACTALTWDAIRMIKTDLVEERYNTTIK